MRSLKQSQNKGKERNGYSHFSFGCKIFFRAKCTKQQISRHINWPPPNLPLIKFHLWTFIIIFVATSIKFEMLDNIYILTDTELCNRIAAKIKTVRLSRRSSWARMNTTNWPTKQTSPRASGHPKVTQKRIRRNRNGRRSSCQSIRPAHRLGTLGSKIWNRTVRV